jgi:RNA polymerase sigma-70 factor (ECF subfamily)
VAGDCQLLIAWRGGDSAAGNALISRYFDAIYRFFRSKVADDVEDLVQSTFLSCAESTTAVSDDGFRAFLYTIARNRLSDHLRRRYRTGEHVDWDDVSVQDLGTSPSGVVARNQREGLLMEAMRRLPVDWQIALELAYWEDLGGPDIAAVLGIQENTVRSRLARARARLRDELAGMSSDESAETTMKNFGIT